MRLAIATRLKTKQIEISHAFQFNGHALKKRPKNIRANKNISFGDESQEELPSTHITLGVLISAELQKQTHTVSVTIPRGTYQCSVSALRLK